MTLNRLCNSVDSCSFHLLYMQMNNQPLVSYVHRFLDILSRKPETVIQQCCEVIREADHVLYGQFQWPRPPSSASDMIDGLGTPVHSETRVQGELQIQSKLSRVNYYTILKGCKTCFIPFKL